MLRIVLISLFLLFSGYLCLSPINDRPIIGIVSEEVNTSHVRNATSYIMASYVKFLESSGARVVPIMIHKSTKYYRDVLSKINGVLFPGGRYILESDGYGRAGKIIFDIAVEMNDKGDYFPLWGTCLGFELLNYVVAKKMWMKNCAARDLPTNIKFVEGYEGSRIFRELQISTKIKMESENSIYHNHQWCLTPQNYSLSGLDKYFKVLAVNQDYRNDTFVSIVEAYKYPFYGVAFHPEKPAFEWIVSRKYQKIPHAANSIEASQYFSNFFVNEARKNAHHFKSKKLEDSMLIYNYNPVFTGKYSNSSVQNYYFT